MKIPLMVSAALEAATGMALVLSPSLPIGLLLGSSLDTPVGLSLARGVGITLLSLGVAYWLARNDGQSPSARGLVTAMWLYNSAFALRFSFTQLSRFGACAVFASVSAPCRKGPATNTRVWRDRDALFQRS